MSTKLNRAGAEVSPNRPAERQDTIEQSAIPPIHHNQNFAVVFNPPVRYIGIMKNGGRRLIWLFGSLVFCTGASAISPGASDNPYQAIVERNVFALKPPPPPPNPEDNKPPPPKVTLTGILATLTGTNALMKVQLPAKPGKPAEEQSLMMREGERNGEIEVVSIDAKEGLVRLTNYGTFMVVAFDRDAKPPTGPAPVPGAGAVPPPATSGAPYNPAAPGNVRTLPIRTLRLPTSGTAPAPAGAPGAAQPPGVSGALVPGQPQAVAQGNQLSPEEQDMLIEAQREVGKAKGDPLASLLPPTRLNPTANTVGQPTAADGNAQPAQPGAPAPPPIPGRPVPLPGRPF